MSLAPPLDLVKSAVLSTKGRVIGLCWEHQKPKGPEGGGLVSVSPRLYRRQHLPSPRILPSVVLNQENWRVK